VSNIIWIYRIHERAIQVLRGANILHEIITNDPPTTEQWMDAYSIYFDVLQRSGQLATSPVPAPKPRNRVLESMTKIDDGVFFVRIWAELPEENIANEVFERCPYNAKLMQDWLRRYDNPVEYRSITRENWTIKAKRIADTIGQMVHVNAVEVIDRDGQGFILYPDWK
jgi:hypothetical protein